MEIRDYATLAIKCRLVEEYNKKVVVAKSTRGEFKKKVVSQGRSLSPFDSQTEISQLVTVR